MKEKIEWMEIGWQGIIFKIPKEYNHKLMQDFGKVTARMDEDFAKFLQDTISADMLFHPSNLKKHFEDKIAALTGRTAR